MTLKRVWTQVGTCTITPEVFLQALRNGGKRMLLLGVDRGAARLNFCYGSRARMAET